uniref:Uncharacterized protein n=1 Tax=Zooxanthella nutricula TaxID=1333877 RepID=A0A6V0EME5_9DINO|mmetsp:Transcript_18745/g.56062  ORF Transcript_18745/g.56062 Transcript_18745/m.56062 type:complete len:142 (+) Transcript_18745:83-508(+)|eukprot:CAMPEP_0198542238 /NCGR_PEP_ID=MMETSP1462-20131121/56810_1 /TAXON_ID=1333877 /ORGANISM="Brandtodinium nutriculum, Strain RCC3387" /LENGTH=141 /DNA_ID=CAMNT_0044272445 /DNA_START=82 /DNA_END=507 /DNA_ORIENTATION=+
MASIRTMLSALAFAACAATAASLLAKGTSAAGHCSIDDRANMLKAGGGYSDGSFPSMCAACGHSSWGLFSGFNKDTYVDCLVGKANLTAGCANCFAGAGQYGYSHCKWSCMFSWSSSGCLSCEMPYNSTLVECVGFQPPQA